MIRSMARPGNHPSPGTTLVSALAVSVYAFHVSGTHSSEAKAPLNEEALAADNT